MRAVHGERCCVAVPHGHRKTIAVTAGLRLDGIIAPRIIDGAMDGNAFRTYVERVLIAGPRPGNIVITDNRPAHEVRGAKYAAPVR